MSDIQNNGLLDSNETMLELYHEIIDDPFENYMLLGLAIKAFDTYQFPNFDEHFAFFHNHIVDHPKDITIFDDDFGTYMKRMIKDITIAIDMNCTSVDKIVLNLSSNEGKIFINRADGSVFVSYNPLRNTYQDRLNSTTVDIPFVNAFCYMTTVLFDDYQSFAKVFKSFCALNESYVNRKIPYTDFNERLAKINQSISDRTGMFDDDFSLYIKKMLKIFLQDISAPDTSNDY